MRSVAFKFRVKEGKFDIEILLIESLGKVLIATRHPVYFHLSIPKILVIVNAESNMLGGEHNEVIDITITNFISCGKSAVGPPLQVLELVHGRKVR